MDINEVPREEAENGEPLDEGEFNEYDFMFADAEPYMDDVAMDAVLFFLSRDVDSAIDTMSNEERFEKAAEKAYQLASAMYTQKQRAMTKFENFIDND